MKLDHIKPTTSIATDAQSLIIEPSDDLTTQLRKVVKKRNQISSETQPKEYDQLTRVIENICNDSRHVF